MDTLKQSQRFPFLNLFVERSQSSVTQGVYNLVASDGTLVQAGFDLSAPYDKEAMIYCQRDGRTSPWFKTDKEIIDGLRGFIESGNAYMQKKTVDKIRAAIIKDLIGKRVQVPCPARDEKGFIIEGRYVTIAGTCDWIGSNEVMGYALQATIDRMPLEVQRLEQIKEL